MRALLRPVWCLFLIATSFGSGAAAAVLDARAIAVQDLALTTEHDESRCGYAHDHGACARLSAERALPPLPLPPFSSSVRRDFSGWWMSAQPRLSRADDLTLPRAPPVPLG